MIDPALSRRRWWEPLAILGLAVLAVAINGSGADVALSRWAYDPVRAAFPLREHPFFTLVLHDGLKWLSAALAAGVVVAAAWSHRASSAWHPYRMALTYLACASIAGALAVAALRSVSAHSCPWDLTIFGGRFDEYRLFDATPAAPGPGKCMPSGHASTGFMWIAAIYAVRFLPPPAGRELRKGGLVAAVIGWGVVASATQVLRGAHFVSHTLLTAAVCWAIAWTLALAWPARTGRVT